MDKAGLQERMRNLLQRQRMCLTIQKLLIALAIVFYRYAIVLLPAHVAFFMICGGIFSNQATSLARDKYPDVPLRACRIGKGEGWDPYIMEEAKRLDDVLTVKLLKFNRWTVCHAIAAAVGNGSMWFLSAALVF